MLCVIRKYEEIQSTCDIGPNGVYSRDFVFMSIHGLILNL